MKFIHAGNNPPTKNTFNNDVEFWNNLLNIPDGAFFLSRKINSTSYWLQETEHHHGLKTTEYILHNDANILVVNLHNIKNIFEKYGTLKRNGYHWSVSKYPSVKDNEKQIMDEIKDLNKYLATFKYVYKSSDDDKIRKLMKHSNYKSCYVKNPNKKDFKNWCFVFARINYLYDELYRISKYNKQYDPLEYYYDVDYNKIKQDYDGIYFPKELFKYAYRFCGDELYIRETLNQLITDTLIIFKWCLL
jgi:hypothetical protein